MDRTHCSPHPTSPHRLQEPHRPCPVAQLGNALREKGIATCCLDPASQAQPLGKAIITHSRREGEGIPFLFLYTRPHALLGQVSPIFTHQTSLCGSWCSGLYLHLLSLPSVLISLRIRCQLTVPLQRGCPEQIPPSPCLPPRAACVNNTTNRPSGLPLPSPNC